MDWIKCSEQMPESSVGVLITDGEIVTAAQWDKKHELWTGHGFGGYEWEFDFFTSDITHWIPLPLPPEDA